MSRFTTNVKLLSNAAATGAASLIDMGGRFLFAAVGTFDGATVTLQIKGPDDATFVAVPSGALTAAGSALVYLPDNSEVKAVISGGSEPAGLYASLRLCQER